MDKGKKKTLTISTNLKKKIDTSAISSGKKKSYLVEKKKTFKANKPSNRNISAPKVNFGQDIKKKNFKYTIEN